MKKYDILTPLGLVVGCAIIIFGVITSGGIENFFSLLNIPSFFIVLGGVLAGLFVSFRINELKKVGTIAKQAFRTQNFEPEPYVDLFVAFANKARKGGLLSLEAEMGDVEDRFLKKGILLAVDGVETDTIEEILNLEVDALEERHRKGRSIFEKAAEYAPAWGMIGTLIGLVLMLKNMDDPSLLGPNMAVALLTTLYGSLLANLVFQPLAAKLSLQTEQEIFLRQCVIEGVIGVQTGQNPGMVEERLAAFLSTEERLKRKKNKLEKGAQGVKEIEI